MNRKNSTSSISESIKRKSTLKRKSTVKKPTKKETKEPIVNTCIKTYIKEHPVNKFIEKETSSKLNFNGKLEYYNQTTKTVLNPAQANSFLEFLKLYNILYEYECSIIDDPELKYMCMRYSQPDANTKLEYFLNLYNHCYKLKLPIITLAKFKKNKNEISGKLLKEYLDIFSIYGGIKPKTDFSKRRSAIVVGTQNYNEMSKFKSHHHIGRT